MKQMTLVLWVQDDLLALMCHLVVVICRLVVVICRLVVVMYRLVGGIYGFSLGYMVLLCGLVVFCIKKGGNRN